MAQQINLTNYAFNKPAPQGWTKRVKRDRTGKVTAVTFRRGR